MQYLTLDDVVANIKRLGTGTLMSKLDLDDDFKYIPVCKEDWPLLGSTFFAYNSYTHLFEKVY